VEVGRGKFAIAEGKTSFTKCLRGKELGFRKKKNHLRKAAIKNLNQIVGKGTTEGESLRKLCLETVVEVASTDTRRLPDSPSQTRGHGN